MNDQLISLSQDNSEQTPIGPELTFKEVSERLRNLYISPEYNFLNAKRSQQTFLHAMRKSRSETICSSLLAWVFDNYEFNYQRPPLALILRVLAHNAVAQDNSLIDPELRDAIVTNDFEITKLNVVLEEINISEARKRGFLDLMLVAKIKFASKEQIIRILIENKIDSSQHDSQCKRYLEYFTKYKLVGLPDEIKGNFAPSDVIDLFVFLSISKPEDNEKAEIPAEYIFMTHQEMVDNVLLPLLSLGDNYSRSSRLYLQEFYDTLTSLQTGNKPPIAMDAQTKKILRDFYINNQEIIDAAVLEGCRDSEIKNAIQKSQKRNSITFNVSHPQWGVQFISNQRKLLEDVIVEILRQQPYTSQEINDLFNPLGKFIVPEDDTTSGYGDPVQFVDGKFRISDQKLRNVKNLNSFKTITTGLGFEID